MTDSEQVRLDIAWYQLQLFNFNLLRNARAFGEFIITIWIKWWYLISSYIQSWRVVKHILLWYILFVLIRSVVTRWSSLLQIRNWLQSETSNSLNFCTLRHVLQMQLRLWRRSLVSEQNLRLIIHMVLSKTSRPFS